MAADTLHVSLKRTIDDSYDIIFGTKLFPQIARDLKESLPRSKYVIVTDSNVGPLYAGALGNALGNEGLQTHTISFAAGEANKTLKSCSDMLNEMASLKCGRDSAILALGGGVVGDMAGFMAAVNNRGIPYIQIPTTVLSQADSAVGGKTAVDTEHGKNLIGAFKQPWRVYIDVSTLDTLTDKEYRNGLAETVKHGVIANRQFFEYLFYNAETILKRSPESSLHIAKNNCAIKGSYVQRDPEEKGVRAHLNYGHTVGHAVELLSNYTLSHGESVAIGMMVAGRISNMMELLPSGDLADQEWLLERFGLPTTIPAGISNSAIIEATTRDKKARDGRARYVLPVKIGQMYENGSSYSMPIDESLVLRALDETR